MKNILAIGMLLLIATVSHADTYKIDSTASKVEWKGGKKIGSFHNGEIKVKGGQIETDKKGVVTGGNVIVDMKTISNIDLKDDPDNQKKLVGHLSNEDFFNVEKFPESKFVIKGVKAKPGSKNEFTVNGEFTMIGKTEPINFDATISSDKSSLTGSATVTIERLKWGLQYGSGSIFKSLTANKIINDTFELKLNLFAKK